jgi:hypothetical protein
MSKTPTNKPLDFFCAECGEPCCGEFRRNLPDVGKVCPWCYFSHYHGIDSTDVEYCDKPRCGSQILPDVGCVCDNADELHWAAERLGSL